MELLIFVQTNFQVIENLGVRMHLKQLNHDNIDMIKIPTMPSQAEEEENHYDNKLKGIFKGERERHARDTLKSKKCDPEFFFDFV